MKKILTISVVSILAFFVGRQGADAPNKKASFASKIQFASTPNIVFAAGAEEDAGKMAEGLWEFAIESDPASNPSVYEFVEEILNDFSDTMVAEGYAQCSDIPTSGSVLLSGGNVTVNFSGGAKLVPSGSNWDNSGATYQKRVTASVGGNEFAEIQYDCSANTNIYFKYDFNEFQIHDRVIEVYLQKGNGGKLSLEFQTTCTDFADCMGKQNTFISFHTPDGDEIKVIGARTEDTASDLVKSISIHGHTATKIADIHIMDHTDISSTDDLDPLNIAVTGACVDFSQATYIPVSGAADCLAEGVAASNQLVISESDAFGVGNVRPATINSITVSY